MTQEGGQEKRFLEDMQEMVSKAGASGAVMVYSCVSPESIGESLQNTIQTVLSIRDNVVMIRVNKESAAKLDELVEGDWWVAGPRPQRF